MGFFVVAEGGDELVVSVEVGFVLLDLKEWFDRLTTSGSLCSPRVVC